MNIDKINENHKRFKDASKAIDKLTIAVQNAVLQLKAASKAMEEMEYIANSLGYKIDKDTGVLKTKS